MAGRRSDLRVTASTVADARVLTVDGVLDDTTYIPLRDAIVKAARDEPRAVVIDVTMLAVRDDPAWAVFTSARWQVTEWPDIPIGLVCAHDKGQHALRRNGINRYVPVYPTLQCAVTEPHADGLRRYRRRARHPAANEKQHSAMPRANRSVVDGVVETDCIHAVSMIPTELVEIALRDTDIASSLRLETGGSTVSAAVQYVGGGGIRC